MCERMRSRGETCLQAAEQQIRPRRFSSLNVQTLDAYSLYSRADTCGLRQEFPGFSALIW